MTRTISTPCVGVCSTSSLGDKLCRGCYRTAREVRAWNKQSNLTKAQAIARIDAFKTKVLSDYFVVVDILWLHQACLAAGVRIRSDVSPYYLLWDLLQRTNGDIEGVDAVVRIDLQPDSKSTAAQISETTEALWRRLYAIHWNYSVAHLEKYQTS